MQPYMHMIKKAMEKERDGKTNPTMAKFRKSLPDPVKFWSGHAVSLGRIWQGQQGIGYDARMTIITKEEYELIKLWVSELGLKAWQS